MGIHRFFYWFKRQFQKDIVGLRTGQTFKHKNTEIDNLMIDMNGVFHNSAQKVYEYGNCKPPARLLNRPMKRNTNKKHLKLKFFKDVCDTVDQVFKLVGPKKRLILCVDGSAPLSKQQQQRARRFRSATEKDEKEFDTFDSNCLTPGTEIMDHLSKYIDWYIKKQISENPEWENIEVVYSGHLVPGEGEHKIINWVRKFGDPEDTHCLYGLDADLIMLTLSTHMPKFYILRDDLYGNNDFFIINIGNVRHQLSNVMKWEGKTFNPKIAIDDFVFLCFMVGNDFLPHIPSVEIIEGGIEVILDVYKNTSEVYGHIIRTDKDGNLVFDKKSLGAFLGTIGQYEQGMLEEKAKKKGGYFPDLLLEKHTTYVDGECKVDVDKYREEYMEVHFPGIPIETVCHKYLEGMQWVLTYYSQGVPNWQWLLPYQYSPFAYHLAEHIQSYKQPSYGYSTPSIPFQQLLSVLPPKSAKLIPEPLNRLLTDEKSPLNEYCPTKIEVDLAGKRKEWEGLTILPFIDQTVMRRVYFQFIKQVNPQDLKRNIAGKSYTYKYDKDRIFHFRSYYGDIKECKAKTQVIEI